MDPERWEKLEALFHESLARPVHERRAFLSEACPDDAMAREVLELLAQYETDPDFLEEQVADGLRSADVLSSTDPSPAVVDGHRIVRLLGRGGMGSVYLAIREIEGFQQHIAVKVVRRGMDTADVLERFRRERRILASLEHPNIARLLDAGETEDGLPYFVIDNLAIVRPSARPPSRAGSKKLPVSTRARWNGGRGSTVPSTRRWLRPSTTSPT